jgi:hypothetical protein
MRNLLKSPPPVVFTMHGWSSVLSHDGVLFHGSFEVWKIEIDAESQIKQTKVAVFSKQAEALAYVNEKNGQQR